MSIAIPLNELSLETRKEIAKTLIITINMGYSSRDKEIYYISDGILYLPFAYGVTELGIKRPKRDNLAPIDINFTAQLYPIQKELLPKVLKKINSFGYCVISVYPGAGKTVLSIKLAERIKLKTMIICHRIVLLEQWKRDIERFTDARVCILKPGEPIDYDYDFYIINVINIPKYGYGTFSFIGNLICDEIHLLTSEKISESFSYIQPRYLIGLSATPYRLDECNAIIDFNFGMGRISKELYHEHTVYKIKTDMKPEIELDQRGKIIWNTVLNSQACNDQRNDMIVDIIRKFPERFFLVLCKRVEQANIIFNKLKEFDEDVTSMAGAKQQTFDREARILVATVGKCSVGFSHEKLDSLILASDAEQYYLQYLGRVFRRPDVEPIIFDIVDNHNTLERHFTTRKKVYKKAGGNVLDFFKKFPEFEKWKYYTET